MNFTNNRFSTNEQKIIDREEAIDAYNNCSLCGTPLEFTYKFVAETSTVSEQAYCPQCHIRTKSHDYTLN